MSINLPLRRTALQYSSTLTTTSTSASTPLQTATTTTITPTTPTTTFICTQCRHATLLRRPKRPYTFTQLITLSDGSTFLHRTTSPQSVYRSTRDTKNAPLWNPTSEKLLNVEKDEAGRLAAFRTRFGRSFDASGSASGSASVAEGGAEVEGKGEGIVEGKVNAKDGEKAAPTEQEVVEEEEDEEDYLLDLISNYGQEQDPQLKGGKSQGKRRG